MCLFSAFELFALCHLLHPCCCQLPNITLNFKMGMKGEDEQEVDNLFLVFDDDGNGILDADELLTMIKFLIRAHYQITGKFFQVQHNTYLGTACVLS